MSTNDVWVEFEFDLPFMPYEGLTIANENVEVTISSAYWNLDKKEWRLYAEDDNTFYDVRNSMKDYSKTDEFKKHIKENYLDLGWRKER